MITHDRPVKFEDVDAAGVVFFARFSTYAHDAMERLFDGLPGGYAALVMERHVGFPAVHVATDFKAPLRYGDRARITATVLKLGTTSCHLQFAFTRARDGVTAATAAHVHVCTNLVTMTKLPYPEDVRAALEAHLAR